MHVPAPVRAPRQHPFVVRLQRFLALSDTDLDRLWQLIEVSLSVPKRRDLVVDGFEYRKLGFVEKGFASRYKLLRNGKRQVVNLILPGDVVGLPGSFLEKACYSVIAVTDMKLQVCSTREYVHLSYERPQFALALAWLAMEEAVTCAEHAINTGRRTPAERLAHLLLELHSRLETVGLFTFRKPSRRNCLNSLSVSSSRSSRRARSSDSGRRLNTPNLPRSAAPE